MKRWATYLWLLLVVAIESILWYLYSGMEDGTTKIISLVIMVVVLLVGIAFSFYEFAHSTRKMRKSLEDLDRLIVTGSFEELKKEYISAYELYMKLNEKGKANFFARISKFREKIEEQMRDEKKVEIYLQEMNEATMEEKKEVLAKLKEVFNNLPEGARQKHFARVNQAKQMLESGVSTNMPMLRS